MTAEEVEACQQAIEICLQHMANLATHVQASYRMPRVVDVKEEDNLN